MLLGPGENMKVAISEGFLWAGMGIAAQVLTSSYILTGLLIGVGIARASKNIIEWETK